MNPRAPSVEVAALLIAARTIVADPARWCAWPHALDPYCVKWNGRASPAVRWGALGALDRAAADANAANGSIVKATALLDRAAWEVSGDRLATAHVLNLNASHGQLLAMFDLALEAMPRPAAPAAPDILAIARTLIARPDRWAQGAIALDRNGRVLTTFDGGCRFCASSAVALAAHVLGGDDAARRRIGPAADQAGRLLDCAAFTLGEFESYIGLNDHDSHAQVVAMFDRALEMARMDAVPGSEASRP